MMRSSTPEHLLDLKRLLITNDVVFAKSHLFSLIRHYYFEMCLVPLSDGLDTYLSPVLGLNACCNLSQIIFSIKLSAWSQSLKSLS